VQRQKVQDNLEDKLGAIKYESGAVEVQWNNIKKCVLDTMSASSIQSRRVLILMHQKHTKVHCLSTKNCTMTSPKGP
jgi:predicted oxidoreductase (fatty acid repression mutant protein)